MSKANKTWTAEEELLLLKMREGGAKWKEIAKVLGRSPQAVGTRLCLLGGTIKNEKDGEYMDVYALYKGDDLIVSGTLSQISETLGIKTSSLKAYSYASYKNKVPPSRRRELVWIGKVADFK